MKKSILAIFLTTSLSIFSQSRHTISVQSGLIHSFFDNTPLINFKHTSKDQGIFHGVFLGSNGLSYSYALNQKSKISLEVSRLSSRYYQPTHRWGDMNSRTFNTYGINYNRNISLAQKFQFEFGAGMSYRNGVVYQYTVPSPLYYTHRYYESNFGLSTMAGLRYNLNQNFSFYSLVDLRSIIYYLNREELFTYPELHPGYPNRFDLSLKLGLSFHF